MAGGTRIDKWLWAARFFKTRALATKACDLSRIEHGPKGKTQPAKPAREIHPGDTLKIRTEGGIFEVEVLALSDVRGPAAVAQTLYRETEESRKARAEAAEARKLEPYVPPLRTPGRPTKRDRRLIHRFRTED
jgi:ribosome-associated heat shock protein Hsp15